MRNYFHMFSAITLSFVSLNAFAAAVSVPKTVQLKSSEGLEIKVSALVEETDADSWGHQTRKITSLYVSTSEFGPFRAVVLFNCNANHYPNSWTYQSSLQIDASQGTGGAPYVAGDYSPHQINYAGFGGDSDSCRIELALVKNGQWQTDPVNGTHNFELAL